MKTAELIGPALDWAVELAKGTFWSSNGYFVARNPDGTTRTFARNPEGRYSTDWSQGGPIIEQERIELCSYSNDGVDTAFRSKADERGSYSHEEEYVISVPEVVTWTAWVKYGSNKQDGPTPLIAARRCFVASKLGDKVDVPDELA